MRRRAAIVIAGLLVTGCYSLAPVTGNPPLGAKVAFDVNDAGRFALGPLIGPEVGQVEGRLIQRDNGEFLLGVTAVRQLRGGGEQTWKGEQVRLKSEFVGTMYERRFSPGRSAVLGLITAGAIAAIVSTDLLGAATDPEGKPPGDSGQTRRSPPVFRVPLWSVPLRIPHLSRP
jgi:hypothetical protein